MLSHSAVVVINMKLHEAMKTENNSENDMVNSCAVYVTNLSPRLKKKDVSWWQMNI